MTKYTEEEIKNIRKWRGEGLTWNEISDRNGRSPKAMSIKFSRMVLGVPEYNAPEIPPVIVPDDVKSLNERKAATVTIKSRTLINYAVEVHIPTISFDTIEEAAAFALSLRKLTENGTIKIRELNEVEI